LETEQLIKRAKRGDKEALLALIDARKSELYKLAYVYTENKDDAMDAMQDMIVILYQKIHQLKNNESFYSWSKTILVNCCRNILRKKQKLVVMQEMQQVSYQERYEAREHMLDILSCLKILNPHQQEAIKLKYFSDLDYETIARISNVPLGTVKSRISTGLVKLKESLGGEFL
jgi:RNA polymerase sigma factor (sigma-70 family)